MTWLSGVEMFTCGKRQPEGMAILCDEGARPYGKGARGQIHDGREGGHGEEDEGGRGQHQVAGIQEDRHGEQDVGQQPAAEGCPGETERVEIEIWIPQRKLTDLIDVLQNVCFLPERGGGISSGVSVLEDEAAGAVERELLCDVEDGVGQASLQGPLVLLLQGALPAEHLVVVNGLVELHHRVSCSGNH